MRRSAAVLLFVLMACAGRPPTSAILPGVGYRDPRIANLPRCAFGEFQMELPKTVVAPEGEFAFRLPSDFTEVETPQFIHGGKLWQHGKNTVSLQYGHWALESFGETSELCVGQAGGFDTVFIRLAGPSPAFVLWFLGSGPTGGHDLIMGLNGEVSSDEQLLLSIGQSVFRTPK